METKKEAGFLLSLVRARAEEKGGSRGKRTKLGRGNSSKWKKGVWGKRARKEGRKLEDTSRDRPTKTSTTRRPRKHCKTKNRLVTISSCYKGVGGT